MTVNEIRSVYVLERMYGDTSQPMLVSEQREPLDKYVQDHADIARERHGPYVTNQSDVVLDHNMISERQELYVVTAYGWVRTTEKPVSMIVSEYRLTCVEFASGEE